MTEWWWILGGASLGLAGWWLAHVSQQQRIEALSWREAVSQLLEKSKKQKS